MEVIDALWPVQDAKSRFSELLNTCLIDGPQTISRRGVPQAVIVSLEQWKQATSQQPTLKDLLLGSAGRCEIELPERGQGRHRESDQD